MATTQHSSSIHNLLNDNLPLFIAVVGLLLTSLLFGIFTTSAHLKTQQDTLGGKLKKTNEEFEEFSYIASHDLKEPMRGIQILSQYIQSKHAAELSGDVQTKFERIIYLTQNMQQLIDDLLHYSRLGNSEVTPEKVDIGALLDSIKTDTLAESNEEIEINISDNMPKMMCDRAAVKELFELLINNALTFNDSQVKTVNISTTLDSENPKRHTLQFKDNGISIDTKHFERIFKLFYRLHKKEAYGGGTGSGLAYAQKIVNNHNGSISIESDGETGSTFLVTLSELKQTA